jgi:hypothetical protein
LTTKNPYEIRADLLVLAQKICVDLANESENKSAPTVADIINTAKQLNDFVSETPPNLRRAH